MRTILDEDGDDALFENRDHDYSDRPLPSARDLIDDGSITGIANRGDGE